MSEPIRDLDRLLAGLSASRRPGSFTVARLPVAPAVDDEIQAIVREDEGWTVVVPDEVASVRSWTGEPGWAWLTLDVHSSLEAVGLTAAISAVLAEERIPCNVIAGAAHDHLLVAAADAERAIRALGELSGR